MSRTLPIIEPRAELIDDLLRTQRSLTAVERFSQVYEERGSQGPAQEPYYRDLLPLSLPGAGEQYAFEVNLDHCTGCKSCVVACHTLNGLEEGEAWRRVGTVASGGTDDLNPLAWVEELLEGEVGMSCPSATAGASSRLQHVTTACHHCADPGCLSGCPVQAYEKNPVTGIVRHLDDQCIGCKYCTMMCPYEVPRYSERLGIVRKCDMCQQRLAVGEAPACVQACPNGAIAIRVVQTTPRGATGSSACEQGMRNASIATEDVARLAPGAAASDITRPTTVYKTEHPEWFQSALAQDAGLDPVADEHAPLACLLVATQVSVGLLLWERIGAGLAWGLGQEWSFGVTQLTAFVALMFAVLGLAVAPLHLGQPLRSWRIFLGLRTSWLSREAVLLGQYAGMLAGVVLLAWGERLRGWLPASWPVEDCLALVPTWGVAAGLGMTIPVGLAGLYCSGMIYIATRRVLWRRSRTLLRCAGTMLVGGLAVLGAVLCLGSWAGLVTVDRTGLLLVWLGTALLTLLKLTWEYRVLVSPRGGQDSYDLRSRVLLQGPLRHEVERRFIAGCVGLMLTLCCLGLTNVAGVSVMNGGVSGVACLAAGILVLGELQERLLYFSSVVYDRMPGTLK